ncbi:uncharacterized protein EKO05_0001528 [Ascochyta rabiei]|uniref:uncharacterized protein n=1 Tax=Didymella rabiei TaxID=5454 RepID=UPI0019029704|nr:uncharacterized protein EKO05_0001528 [Ascochyta rabiei]UPX10892.1 hypothetical protein EKO05_0001528 [Ascochyta rabiei]
MPSTLHPCLKRGLDLTASSIDPSDLVQDRPAEHHDAQLRSAKRRRIEAIARQCLRGNPPIILTASLKGPFTSDWKNPWARDVKARADGQGKSGNEPSVGQAKRRSKASHAASPEASRAVGHTEEHTYSQPEFEPLPATAPLPDEDDLSGATDFFSVETEQFIANHSPANPFWLRRPAASMTLPENSQIDKSPTRQRRTHACNTRQSLQLALPGEPLGGRPLPIRATPPDELRSSASASMDISSLPTKSATTVKQYTIVQDSSHTTSSSDAPDSSRLRADSAQEDEARSSQAAQNAQTTPTVISLQARVAQPPLAQSFESLVPATTYKMPATVQVPQSSPTRGAAGMGSQSPRDNVQRSAERLASEKPMPATRRRPSSATHTTEYDISNKLRHNLVASPAPASSTGFLYRRVGNPRGEGSNAPKAKPRTVNFSSSPMPRKKDGGPTCVRPEPVALVVETGASEIAVPHAVAEAADGSVVLVDNEEVAEIQDIQQESHRSKQSQYSTQAAMLLAQLEFQEDSSQSSTSSTTLRPWSQPAQNTPPPLLLQPSPAITPLSVFNARLDESFCGLVGGSEHRGPPVSTQDLFNAASPFAFSTVKKGSERPRRSSLRFALASKSTESTTAKSPTPSVGRVPLKQKNSPTPRSFAQEKSSLYVSKLASQSPQRTANEVKLPQLDLHTSLDFGPNTDFTERFLNGLDDEP